MLEGRHPDGSLDVMRDLGHSVHEFLGQSSIFSGESITKRATGAKALRLRHAQIRRQRAEAAYKAGKRPYKSD